MRQLIQHLPDLFCQYPDHESSVKFSRISDWLDAHPDVLQLVADDLSVDVSNAQGAQGLSVESVLRAAIYQADQGLTFRKLEFSLADSMTAKTFCRVGFDETVSDSTLCCLIGMISQSTWEQIQCQTVRYGMKEGIENGRKVRIDATVTATNIHSPTDSSLLADAIRCVSRVAKSFREAGVKLYSRFSSKGAKKLALAILNAKSSEKQVELYERLIEKCREVLYQRQTFLNTQEQLGVEISGTFGTLEELFDKLERIVDQTHRRVIEGGTVPPDEKLVSVFECHTDIIVKKRRETQFGHKINITSGTSNLIFDVEVLEGNPADSDIFINSLERTAAVTGRVPTQIAADGGYSSIENVDAAKEMGVKDVSFSKHVGLGVLDMCKSEKVHQKLRNFRAGIEAHISNLKRGLGMFVCPWKGQEGFNKYIWSRVVTYNLNIIARH